MDREHQERFEAIERRLKAIEDRLMPQSLNEADRWGDGTVGWHTTVKNTMTEGDDVA